MFVNLFIYVYIFTSYVNIHISYVNIHIHICTTYSLMFVTIHSLFS